MAGMSSRFFVAGTLVAVLMLPACGGGGDSAEPATQANASADTAAPQNGVGTIERQAEPSQPSGKQTGSASDRKPGSGSEPRGESAGDAAVEAGAAPVAPVAPSGRAGQGEAGGGKESQPDRKANGKSEKKKPKKPKQAAIPIPPQFEGKSIFQIARQTCGDPLILEYVPEEQQENPEQVAEMARSFAPPGKEQEAYEGCLAGLHDIGL